ncbi:Helix-turn-helix domain-containing protein [Halorientalis persicus]|uniref:Helix-turn-helix domain-containing protein n=1 Tax=Halorientalis persicus TaxID=1367881 RepID=A0A1H8FHA6_9EURY|nr:winged helix-turn-helix domain-containing protein [Halorientalis persicus]SEN31119.1 Helix-turn-helix domain-containing protein [Halorientalis persicus]
MDADSDVDAIATLLADDCARTILEATAADALSAEELSDRCGVSQPTVYRRLEDLRAHDLVTEQTRADADGHHYKVFTASLDRVVVDLSADGLTIRLSRRDRMADRFTQFVEDLR